jgi:hypothetical protein
MVVIDAELQEGEIGQLAQAIQGAFGGQRANAERFNGLTRSLPSPETAEVPDELDGEGIADAEMPLTLPTAPRPRGQRKVRTPAIDDDLDPAMEPSFKAYADARNVTAATSVLMRFLIVAAWLHEERSGTKITASRAYTCFRFIEWPTNTDFDQPLRDLQRKRQFLELKPEDKGKGEFTITRLGLNEATKMKGAS